MGLHLKPLNSETPLEEVLDLPEVGKALRFGRSESCRVQIDDPTVSGDHAILKVEKEDRVVLFDSGSRHGTFVNEEKIDEKVLEAGDNIRIGRAEFLVESNGSANGSANGSTESSSDDGEKVALLESEVADLKQRMLDQAEDSENRETALQQQLSEMRASMMDKDAGTASLQYEITSRDGTIAALEKSNEEWSQSYDQLQAAYDENLQLLSQKDEEILTANQARQSTEERAKSNLERLKTIAHQMLKDWNPWLSDSGHEAGSSGEEPEELLQRVEAAAGAVRQELNVIEPIWSEFGEGIQSELRRRCEELQEKIDSLQQEVKDDKDEIAALHVDLEEVRDLVSDEIRRAQGLSRKGDEIEIPERFEKMVVAKDHEIELFKSFIIFLEEFERQIAKYRKSRGYGNRRVAQTMNDFRDRLVAILEANDVKAFTLDLGTHLTPKHRKTVRIVTPEGWGGKKFSEIRFQPGEVIQVVQAGYEVGTGTFTTVLRKVDVVIRSESEE